MLKRELIREKTNEIVRTWTTSADLDVQIKVFALEETFGILSDIDYYESGTYEIEPNYYGSNQTSIIFSGDNGFEIFVIKEDEL